MSQETTLSLQALYDRFLALSVRPDTDCESRAKPMWLKTAKVHGEKLFDLKRNLRRGSLHTVCEEARCPNIAECMNSGTATFMILGDTCTRGCRFCNIKTGNPGGVLDPEEPQKVASSIADLQLDYAVLTMVDRDDLADGGAAHVAATVREIKRTCPSIYIEILTGDFQGRQEPLAQVLASGICAFAHNLETVERLTPRIRDRRASYAQSLEVLRNAKILSPQMYTKSGIMLGLGETPAEVDQCLRDMRAVGVEILTIGQYLRPTPRHVALERYAHPEEFSHWEARARELGFQAVASGPLVRSSYRAAHLFPRIPV